jgi:heme ABC exporter ATP-binding subunit CcmA
MAPAVLLRSAVALAGRFPALAGVDLDVAPGEVVVLEGPNGAGKTSVLRACAGLLALSAGEAVVLGHDLCRDRIRVRGLVGLLGHDPVLYDDLTVAENVRFSVRAAGGQKRSRAREREALGRAEEALERLGLVGRLPGTAAGRLSAGQRRRAALAALVARRPALWLLDEPHAALDEAGRSVVDDIVEEARAAGAAVLLASHEPAASATLASRVVSMAGGRVLADVRLGELPETSADARPGGEVPVGEVPVGEVRAGEVPVGDREGVHVA